MLTLIISSSALALLCWNRNNGRTQRDRLINTIGGGFFGLAAGCGLALGLAYTAPREVSTKQIVCAEVVKPYILIQQPSDGKLPTGSTSCSKTEVKVQQLTGVKSWFAVPNADETTYKMILTIPSESK